MKNLKVLFLLSISIFLSNCDKSKIIKRSPNYKVEFKDGKREVKNNLQNEFEFKSLDFGVYLTNNSFSGDKKGVAFNFEMENLEFLSDSLLLVYATKSSEIAKKQLINLESFDIIVTSFSSSIKKGNLEKETTVKIINNLK